MEELNLKELLRSKEEKRILTGKISGIVVQLDASNVTCLARVPARFNRYPHYLANVLVKVTEIKENKKLIYAYLMRII